MLSLIPLPKISLAIWPDRPAGLPTVALLCMVQYSIPYYSYDIKYAYGTVGNLDIISLIIICDDGLCPSFRLANTQLLYNIFRKGGWKVIILGFSDQNLLAHV